MRFPPVRRWSRPPGPGWPGWPPGSAPGWPSRIHLRPRSCPPWRRCARSTRGFAGTRSRRERFSGRSDGTQEIARRYTDKVFDVPWKGFGPQKQAAVELASHDVVLNVDCDERVTAELAEEIGAILSGPGMAAAYTVPRRTFLGGKEIRHCGW